MQHMTQMGPVYNSATVGSEKWPINTGRLNNYATRKALGGDTSIQYQVLKIDTSYVRKYAEIGAWLCQNLWTAGSVS